MKRPVSYDLYSPSLCHGFSSLVAIQMCAYSSYRNPKLLTNLERHIQKMIAGYRKNNENELNLTDIRNKSILIEGHLNDLSILTGSVGIAITLLSLKRTTKTGKLLMID
ncbi:lanthionine synthetase LanC family protein [Evtepia gabavorous]|uniref:lanthionine synthetase LanC family protein n=1 Tax=Evtepia gabavorous TaxID=2211183 RepID=UPI0039B67AE6